METKFTPGPWVTYIEDVVYAGNRKIADCDSSNLADRPLPANAEDKANARLIAAAPDLFAALAPFAMLLQEHNSAGLDDRPIFGINNALITLGDLRRSATALAKATGG